jgi:hypothetical protein
VLGRRGAPELTFTVAALVVLVGTFLPWLRTGSTSRSSYDLLGLLSRLDFAPDGPMSTLVRCWPLVPVLLTGAVVLAWWRWTWAALVVAAAALLYAGGVGVAMIAAVRGTGISTGPGPWVATIGSLDLVVSSVWLAVTSARRLGLPAPVAAPLADPS